jgi:putative hemolysin
MRKAEVLLVLAAMLLAGCERPEPAAKGVDASNPLEVAARERGVVRPEADSPVGVFERRHDLGRDAMCVVPDGAGKWRFAVTASFGTTLSCLATGTMVREGDKWRMRFAGVEGCEALVHEEEDELRLPGRLPPQCARLCPNRASLSGLQLPRASWSADDAGDLRITDRSGNITHPCAG